MAPFNEEGYLFFFVENTEHIPKINEYPVKADGLMSESRMS